jgi:hypothetical protein
VSSREVLGFAFGIAALMSVAMAHGREAGSGDCHPLLMDSECARFHKQTAAAKDEQSRVTLNVEFMALIAERERLCPCPESSMRTDCWRRDETAAQRSSHAKAF